MLFSYREVWLPSAPLKHGTKRVIGREAEVAWQGTYASTCDQFQGGTWV